VGGQRIRHYLEFLDGALLVRLIEPLEIRLKRKRGAAKLCLSDHSLRASWLGEVVPLEPEELSEKPLMADVAGRIAESIVGYFLASLGLTVQHRPTRHNEPEIDFVITAGDSRIPVEVKYQARIDHVRDADALRSFISKPQNRAPVGIMITRNDSDIITIDDKIIMLPMKTLLLAR
jgi:predicted AAA+ superfamily ATPase